MAPSDRQGGHSSLRSGQAALGLAESGAGPVQRAHGDDLGGATLGGGALVGHAEAAAGGGVKGGLHAAGGHGADQGPLNSRGVLGGGRGAAPGTM
jgi:hypothetical protein